MRVLILLLILPVIFMAPPGRAADVKTGASTADEARPEDADSQKVQSPPARAERPKREAVKMSRPSVCHRCVRTKPKKCAGWRPPAPTRRC